MNAPWRPRKGEANSRNIHTYNIMNGVLADPQAAGVAVPGYEVTMLSFKLNIDDW